MTALRDLRGLPPFNRLTVVERGPNAVSGQARWWCDCTCGNRILVESYNLTSGNTQSCGCLQKDRASQANMTHGLSTRSEYFIWHTMIRRCFDSIYSHYAYYGGRGITVCERWRDSFELFLEDMGPRPTPQHSLDRYPDHDGNYEKANCRWATKREQQRNMRSNVMITFNDKTQCVQDWAKELHIPNPTLSKRLRRWSVERALTTPIQTQYARDR